MDAELEGLTAAQKQILRSLEIGYRKLEEEEAAKLDSLIKVCEILSQYASLLENKKKIFRPTDPNIFRHITGNRHNFFFGLIQTYNHCDMKSTLVFVLNLLLIYFHMYMYKISNIIIIYCTGGHLIIGRTQLCRVISRTSNADLRNLNTVLSAA